VASWRLAGRVWIPQSRTPDMHENDKQEINTTEVQPMQELPPTKEQARKTVPSQHVPPRYYVEVLGKALAILDTLKSSSSELRLTDIADKNELSISTTFRFLRTFEERGYVRRNPKTKRYKLSLGFRAYRIGYAQLSSNQLFSQKVTQGLVEAAKRARVELLVMDNRNSAEEALKNAARLIDERVDFVIEYQFYYRIGPVLADMFSKAAIPTLAISVPQPKAIYFGVDHYAVGFLGGETLGRFAQRNWSGRVDHILLLEITDAGPVPHSRALGTIDGIRSVGEKLAELHTLHRNSKGTEIGGYMATRRVLAAVGKRDRVLIASENDDGARGALRAVREFGREQFTAILALGWGPDAALEKEIRNPKSPLIAAVAHFPEKYGSQILPIVLQCLNGQPVPPAVHAEYQLIARDEVLSVSSSGASQLTPPDGGEYGYKTV
jgi:ribose transport system substrate-binding protein